MENKEFNPYEVLGVQVDATAEDIKNAYREKSKEAHPDTGGSEDEFTRLKKAFDILSDPKKRNLYDKYGVYTLPEIEAEAKLVAIQIALQVIDNFPGDEGIDKELVSVFESCLKDLESQEKRAKKAKDKLLGVLERLHIKPDDDFLSPEIERLIGNYDKMMRQAQLNHAIHSKALTLVKEYRFDIAKIIQAPHRNIYGKSPVGIFQEGWK